MEMTLSREEIVRPGCSASSILHIIWEVEQNNHASLRNLKMSGNELLFHIALLLCTIFMTEVIYTTQKLFLRLPFACRVHTAYYSCGESHAYRYQLAAVLGHYTYWL